jgi:hypothetical protein
MATPNPRDISELQRAVNDASSRTTALWVSFMTFAAYLIVAAGSVSHLALFQETAIKLPILAAELPLVAFFAIAPFFLLLFHFYLFLNLVTLSRRISTYNRVLVQDVTAEDDRNLLRARLDTFLVVQLLSRPPKKRNRLNGWLLSIVVWITLVGVPILILLQFQLTVPALPPWRRHMDPPIADCGRPYVDLVFLVRDLPPRRASFSKIESSSDCAWLHGSGDLHFDFCRGVSWRASMGISERQTSSGVSGQARSDFRLFLARARQYGDRAATALFL